MYVSLQAFQKYTNVYNENTELQQSYIDTAEDIVQNHLGYNLKLNTYTAVLNGTGTNEIQLKAKPIKTIFKVLINNENQRPGNFETAEEFLYIKNGIFPQGNKNITAVYEAGYDLNIFSGVFDGGNPETETNEFIGDADAFFEGGEIDGGNAFNKDNRNAIPAVILNTVMRIAALLQSEEDSNIGVTSKSFGESGSRTFINYTNFEKYLSPLSKYCLIRI